MKLSEMSIKYWIDRALEIATIAHEGQRRKGGGPYIEHPKRIASQVEDRLKPIALLHDVPEDTKITLEDLKKEGFPSYIINTIDLLTHKKTDSNQVYWNKILINSDAVTVKVLDIKDNLEGSPSDHARLKYAKALELFKKNGYSI